MIPRCRSFQCKFSLMEMREKSGKFSKCSGFRYIYFLNLERLDLWFFKYIKQKLRAFLDPIILHEFPMVSIKFDFLYSFTFLTQNINLCLAAESWGHGSFMQTRAASTASLPLWLLNIFKNVSFIRNKYVTTLLNFILFTHIFFPVRKLLGSWVVFEFCLFCLS